MKTILLNPFSYELEKHPFKEIDCEPCYINGEFRIYKLFDKHYLHTFKNIIFAERCGKNTELINNIINDIEPEDKARKYFDFIRGKEAIKSGFEYAKKLNFQVK